MFADTRETETVFAPVIQAGLEALKVSKCIVIKDCSHSEYSKVCILLIHTSKTLLKLFLNLLVVLVESTWLIPRVYVPLVLRSYLCSLSPFFY